MSYFHMNKFTLSSAMKRFTVLFEMGRSGTASLLSPSNSVLLTQMLGLTKWFDIESFYCLPQKPLCHPGAGRDPCSSDSVDYA